MRKYFQISFFLGVFAILVFVRQLKPEKHTFTVIKTNVDSNSVQAVTPTSSQAASGPTPTQMIVPTKMPMMGMYRDGTYTGSTEDAFYGYVQVQAVIANGKLSDVLILQYPNDNRTSTYINSQALPLLKQEAITAQSANVDIISGASQTSPAFSKSLGNALAQAK